MYNNELLESMAKDGEEDGDDGETTGLGGRKKAIWMQAEGSIVQTLASEKFLMAGKLEEF